jgi:poly-gamma-glutamate synthesis protein (capsule biosynthesis protein)
VNSEVMVPSGRQLLSGLSLSHEPAIARLLFGGDIAPIRSLERPLCSDSPVDLFLGVRDEINKADLFVANLESPLTKQKAAIAKDGPYLRSDPLCARGLKRNGLDVVTLANNHILDSGERGLLDTIDNCLSAGLRITGAGSNLKSACEPLFFELNGCRIALIAIAEREFSIAGHWSAGAAPVDPVVNSRQLKEARAHADLTIVNVHGGNEYFPLPRPGLVQFCRFLVESGAHAVICHHTHVAGPVEIYKGAPIAYSVGNLLFDNPGHKTRAWHRGYLVALDVALHGAVNLRIVPVNQSERTQGVSAVSPEDSREFLDGLQTMAACLTSDDELQEHWSKWCQSRKERYLLSLRSPILFPGIGVIFRRFPVLHRLILSDKRRRALLALIQCDSHREALQTVLADRL